MPVTMFHCRACGATESKYVAIGARITLDQERLADITNGDVDNAEVVDVEFYDDGVRPMPLRAPVYANDTDREPIDHKVDDDRGPFLRACVNCGTIRMMPRDER